MSKQKQMTSSKGRFRWHPKLYPISLKIGLLLMTLCSSILSNGQASVIAGWNTSNIRSNVSLGETKPRTNYTGGLSVRLNPFEKAPKINVIFGVEMAEKGYEQVLDKSYNFRFLYLMLPVQLCYSPIEEISFIGGLELSTMAWSNIEYYQETYNTSDIGLSFEVDLFPNKILSLYSRFTYGLIPMINYYDIDQFGNFKSEIKDLKNMNLIIGLKFNMSQETLNDY